MTVPNLPPPGWYNDPTGEAAHRWFDGQGWTAHVDGFAPVPPNPAEAALGLTAIETVRPIPGPRAMAGPMPGGPMTMTARPAIVPSGPDLYWVLPVGRTWQAVIAPYLGLFAVLPLIGIGFGLAAIVVGVSALSRPSPDARHGGRGRPVIGIVLGATGLLFWCAVLVVASLHR